MSSWLWSGAANSIRYWRRRDVLGGKAMIRYALHCRACEVDFEAWFASSGAYDEQAAKGLVTCPSCDSGEVEKQIMAPAVRGARRKPASQGEAMARLIARARRHIANTCDYVGKDFAGEARAMHRGEKDERPIWGETSRADAESLAEEGVPALPLPAPFVPPRPGPDEDVH